MKKQYKPFIPYKYFRIYKIFMVNSIHPNLLDMYKANKDIGSYVKTLSILNYLLDEFIYYGDSVQISWRSKT